MGPFYFRRLAILTGIASFALLAATACTPRGKPENAAAVNQSSPTPGPLRVVKTDVVKPWPQIVEERPAPANLPGLDQAETALSQKPKDAQASLTHAYVLYQAQAFELAAAAFEKTASLMPESPTPLLYRGYALRGWGVVQDALAAFQKVTELKGANGEAKSEAYLQIGTLHYLFLQDNDAAKVAFTKSLGANPHQVMALVGLGTLAAAQKQWDAARSSFTRAAGEAQKPADKARAFACLGLVAQQTGDNKGAQVNYRKALAVDPQNRAAKQGLATLSSPQQTLPSAGVKNESKG